MVLEKFGAQTIVYIGSGTNAVSGIWTRYNNFDNLDTNNLPRSIGRAIKDGYETKHKTVLCRGPIPAIGKQPIMRGFWLAIESALTGTFWAYNVNPNSPSFTPSFGYLCGWDITTLEYAGGCGHVALMEGFYGSDKLDFSEQELEDQAAHVKALSVLTHAAGYQRRMAENPDKVRAQSQSATATWRVNHPDKHQHAQETLKKERRANKTYHCELCDIAINSPTDLMLHLVCTKHKKVLQKKNIVYVHPDFVFKYYCAICDWFHCRDYEAKIHFTR